MADNLNFEIYRKWVRDKERTLLDNREYYLSLNVLEEHFFGVPTKKKAREAYRKTEEFRERLAGFLEKDAIYRSYLAAQKSEEEIREEYLAKQEQIDDMIACGFRDFSDKSAGRYQTKKLKDNAVETALKKLSAGSLEELADRVLGDYREKVREILTTWFSEEKIRVRQKSDRGEEEALLNELNIQAFLEQLPDRHGWIPYYMRNVKNSSYGQKLFGEVYGTFASGLPQGLSKSGRNSILDKVKSRIDAHIRRRICEIQEDPPLFTKEEALGLLRTHKKYGQLVKNALHQIETEAGIKDAILDHIPENLVDLYPAARKLHRHFVLHIGPTNSGKTYHAVEEMLKGRNGIYLGPLRLLAYEQYEKIMAKGIPCNLVTGEEEIDNQGSFQSSTIDVLNFRTHYDTAVIDEAQMVTDEFRGGRWTAAIMGILADEIHACAAPEAEEFLCNIIKECGDTVEVIRHERMCPLHFDEKELRFPKDIRQGDALIVFSRRSVHSLAAELQNNGIRCSVIYGALPYDVRHEEARRFMEKETQVVIATDAIGMGLNLPIRRVILMEQKKFDGKIVRPLYSSELKQIVGRAGRAGIFDVGYYTACDDNGRFLPDRIDVMVNEKASPIRRVRIAFPEDLLYIDGKVSDLYVQWDAIPVPDMFIKASSEREIRMAKDLEKYSADKRLIYDLITVPFDEEKEELYAYWYGFAIRLFKEREVSIRIHYYNGKIKTAEDMQEAEETYAFLDLEYQLARKFGDEETKEQIMREKTAISKKMCTFLAKQALEGRSCSVCGKALPWNYQYGRCERCFRDRRFRGQRR